jgi:hypothetical protein
MPVKGRDAKAAGRLMLRYQDVGKFSGVVLNAP